MNEPRDLLTILKEIAHLEAEPAASQRAVARARAAVSELNRHSPAPRIAASWARSILGVAAASIAVLALVHWLVPTGSSRGIAFAEVQRQVAETKTVQFTETNTARLKDGRLAEGYVKQVKILGKYLKREEFKSTPGDPPVGEEKPRAVGGDYIMIFDAQHGKLLSLDPHGKTYNASVTILGIEPDSDTVVESQIKPDPQVDFYSRFRDLPAERARELPPRTIAGKPAVGFIVEEKRQRQRGTDTITSIYWIDSATRLPLRIESTFTSTDPHMADSEWIKTNFVFDAPLAPALFSTDPPAGYEDSAARRREN